MTTSIRLIKVDFCFPTDREFLLSDAADFKIAGEIALDDGKDFRYRLSSMKTVVACSPHWKPLVLCSSFKKGMPRSPT
jgi:hypothetical protein